MAFGAYAWKKNPELSIERVCVWARRCGGYMYVDIDDYMRLSEDM